MLRPVGILLIEVLWRPCIVVLLVVIILLRPVVVGLVVILLWPLCEISLVIRPLLLNGIPVRIWPDIPVVGDPVRLRPSSIIVITVIYLWPVYIISVVIYITTRFIIFLEYYRPAFPVNDPFMFKAVGTVAICPVIVRVNISSSDYPGCSIDGSAHCMMYVIAV